MCRVATECSWNDGSKTQYYIVILDRLLGRSGGLEWVPEWRVRGPLTSGVISHSHAMPMAQDIKNVMALIS